MKSKLHFSIFAGGWVLGLAHAFSLVGGSVFRSPQGFRLVDYVGVPEKSPLGSLCFVCVSMCPYPSTGHPAWLQKVGLLQASYSPLLGVSASVVPQTPWDLFQSQVSILELFLTTNFCYLPSSRDLKFSQEKSFTPLVGLIHRYFIFFETCVNGGMSKSLSLYVCWWHIEKLLIHAS